MRRLTYSGGSLHVPDAVCHALLEYAKALAETGSADAVTIPVYTETGEEEAEVLVGPASQLIATPAGPDPDDDHHQLVADLESRTARLRPARAVGDTGLMWEGFDTAGEQF